MRCEKLIAIAAACVISACNGGVHHGAQSGPLTLAEAEERFYDPDSPERNDSTFIAFLTDYINSGISNEEMMRPLYLLEELSKNAVGSIAYDFEFLIRSDKGIETGTLETQRGRHVLILFYKPGCQHCKACIEELSSNETLNELLAIENIEIIAVDTSGDKSGWDAEHSIPKTWINAIISQESFIEERTYAIRSYPSMYLIDPDGYVILKDETNTDSVVAAAVSATRN